MKRLMIIIILVTTLLACTKDKTAAIANDMIPENGQSIRMGNFVNGVHMTEGKANVLLVNGQQLLALQNFKTDNGPDLKVYLAKDRNASSFIQLGNLKAVSGNQTYSIPGMTDLDAYPYVLIWCQQFSVLFGVAVLQ